MKKLIVNLSLIVIAIFALSFNAQAVPLLQLDAISADGTQATYNPHPDVEDVEIQPGEFTLYALLSGDPDVGTGKYDPAMVDGSWTFYVSLAITPKLDQSFSDPLGSIEFGLAGGTLDTIDVVDGMDWGIPPVDIMGQPDELEKHGIFETYYYQYAFTFSSLNVVNQYNVQDDPGGFGTADPTNGSKSLYYAAFDVNTSGLLGDGDYQVHFDLYDLENNKAPYSHDLTTVPEPATFLLLVTGLGGLAIFRRRGSNSDLIAG